jgi:preprotein translocase subunit SecE
MPAGVGRHLRGSTGIRGDRMFNRFTDYIRGVRQEVSRVSWPTRNELISLTALILVLVVILTLYIWGVDGILGTLLRVFVPSAG